MVSATRMVTVAEVLSTAGYSSSTDLGGDAVVNDAIDESTEEVLNSWGDPVKRTNFLLESDQTNYEIRIDNIKTLRIDHVYVHDDNNNLVEYTSGSLVSESAKTYVFTSEFNKMAFHSDTVGTYDGRNVEVMFVPNSIYWLVRLKAALCLLDRTNVVSTEENTPTLGMRIYQRITRLETSMMPFTAVGSEDMKDFDPTQGENIPQRRYHTY